MTPLEKTLLNLASYNYGFGIIPAVDKLDQCSTDGGSAYRDPETNAYVLPIFTLDVPCLFSDQPEYYSSQLRAAAANPPPLSAPATDTQQSQELNKNMFEHFTLPALGIEEYLNLNLFNLFAVFYKSNLVSRMAFLLSNPLVPYSFSEILK